MTTDNHPITPPLDLVREWAIASPLQRSDEYWAYELYIAHHAARWGADQELEACINYFLEYDSSWGENSELLTGLRSVRRPKPPSLKKQALLQLDTLNADLAMHGMGCDLSQIRRALEQLND